jgi:DNA-binding transcriptional ArsR family regulator
VFRALSDPTRRQILKALTGRELTAGDIAGRFPISGPSISRHLLLLRHAELVAVRRDANRIYYRLRPERIARPVGDFLEAVCPAPPPRRGKRLARAKRRGK